MTVFVGKDTLSLRKNLKYSGGEIDFFSINALREKGLGNFDGLPACLNVLLENVIRFQDDKTINVDDFKAFADWLKFDGKNPKEIAYRPARVLMQDFTGVPAVVDLAAMRDSMLKLGGDPQKINPLTPVDLVIDHSIMIDYFGDGQSFKLNVEKEYERNAERYTFLKWGQQAFKNFRVVPPGTGICHQVNLEYLGKTIWSDKDQNGIKLAYPDTLVGTDSHTTMVNGLSILGWGVGGIEAEAAMLGQPISMLIPEVIGFELKGKMPEGSTATDLVLKIVKALREKGVVGKFVEFYGEGLDNLPLADRATISNMAPEYGATCGFFPVDDETLNYLYQSGRDQSHVNLVEAYSKENGLWREKSYKPIYTDTLSLDMGAVIPAISGPKRPQDHLDLRKAKEAFHLEMKNNFKRPVDKLVKVKGQDFSLSSGKVVIASITSCTNTSNPFVMVAAGLVARKARQLGLKSKPWVKTSLAPGSKVVSDYLSRSNLQEDLDSIGFNLVGYGCTTCIGNSGPLSPEISDAIHSGDLVVTSVLSGNRNFEGRISPDIRANYLASPPLVVIYSLCGDMNIDVTSEPLAVSESGKEIFLKDLWPTSEEVNNVIKACVTREAFAEKYSDVFVGDSKWRDITAPESETYDWPLQSTYIQNPPYFRDMSLEKTSIKNIEDASILAILGDMVTTDHISPAGSFKEIHPAGKYLVERQVPQKQFNSYGSRRGNHEIMMRGTFANIRIRNEILQNTEGGFTIGPDGKEMSIFDASMLYQDIGKDLVVIAGKEYGAGSSRDWAAKGTALLGVKAVIAESFERIHRSNLVGMGVIPLEFETGLTRHDFGLTGKESITILGLDTDLKPLQQVHGFIKYADGQEKEIKLRCRIDTDMELEYIENGGVLHYVLRNLAKDKVSQEI